MHEKKRLLKAHTFFGAAVAAAIAVAKTLGQNKKVVVVIPDDGRRFVAEGAFDFNTSN